MIMKFENVTLFAEHELVGTLRTVVSKFTYAQNPAASVAKEVRATDTLFSHNGRRKQSAVFSLALLIILLCFVLVTKNEKGGD